MDFKKILTTSNGAPVGDNQNSITAGEDGPILLQDFHLIDKLANFDKERVPERVVHAKGAGAHGYFEVTNDNASKYTKAEFLNGVGKKTPLFVRFSTVRAERGMADTIRDLKGFAIKFYTEEGNFDMVCNNSPIFFVKDPIKFPDFIHSVKRDPITNLVEPDTMWDFMSFHPESTHQFTMLFSDRGTPRSYRHMHGFSSHTFKLVNIDGKQYWSKWHFRSDLGFKTMTDEESLFLGGVDPDYYTRDLYNHISSGKTATWTLFFQIIPYEEGLNYYINIFDLTKVVPKKEYPLIEIGKLVLDRNPTNYFCEVEQSGFAPANLVPGIEPSPDKMLQSRLFSYMDTQHYRIGRNYQQLPINRPYRSKFGSNHQRDGLMCYTNDGTGKPNYEPNKQEDLTDNSQYNIAPFKVEGYVSRYRVKPSQIDDFHQCRILYNEVMKEEDRVNLIKNIVNHLKYAKKPTQERVISLFSKVDEDYGNRISKGLASLTNVYDKPSTSDVSGKSSTSDVSDKPSTSDVSDHKSMFSSLFGSSSWFGSGTSETDTSNQKSF